MIVKLMATVALFCYREYYIFFGEVLGDNSERENTFLKRPPLVIVIEGPGDEVTQRTPMTGVCVCSNI